MVIDVGQASRGALSNINVDFTVDDNGDGWITAIHGIRFATPSAFSSETSIPLVPAGSSEGLIIKNSRNKKDAGSINKAKRALQQVQSVYSNKPHKAPTAPTKDNPIMMDIEAAAIVSWQAQQAALAQIPPPAAHADNRRASKNAVSPSKSPGLSPNGKLKPAVAQDQPITSMPSHSDPVQPDVVLQHLKGDPGVTEAIKEVRLRMLLLGLIDRETCPSDFLASLSESSVQ